MGCDKHSRRARHSNFTSSCRGVHSLCHCMVPTWTLSSSKGHAAETTQAPSPNLPQGTLQVWLTCLLSSSKGCIAKTTLTLLPKPADMLVPCTGHPCMAYLSLEQLKGSCLLQLLEHLAQVTEATSRNLHNEQCGHRNVRVTA